MPEQAFQRRPGAAGVAGVLRGHRLADFDDCVALSRDEEVMRFITGAPATRQETWVRMMRWTGMWHLLGFGFLVIEEKQTGRFIGEAGFQRAVAAAQNSPIGTGGSAHRMGNASGPVDHGHHALMRIDAFRAVGGYDETFRANEDAELDYRLRQAGHTIWLTDRTAMTYYPRATVSGLFRQYFGYGGGRARNILKHRMRPRLRQMAPLAILLTLYANHTPQQILDTDALSVFDELGFREHLTPQRSNGLRAMVERIRNDARENLATAS